MAMEFILTLALPPLISRRLIPPSTTSRRGSTNFRENQCSRASPWFIVTRVPGNSRTVLVIKTRRKTRGNLGTSFGKLGSLFIVI